MSEISDVRQRARIARLAARHQQRRFKHITALQALGNTRTMWTMADLYGNTVNDTVIAQHGARRKSGSMDRPRIASGIFERT
jgi:hypothetical protein